MWRSLSTYAGIAWQEFRKKVCDAFTNHGGEEQWNGQTYQQWIQVERQQAWPSYVKDISSGNLWPGTLEIHQAAKTLGAHIEIFVEEDDSYKRISQCGKKKDDLPG